MSVASTRLRVLVSWLAAAAAASAASSINLALTAAFMPGPQQHLHTLLGTAPHHVASARRRRRRRRRGQHTAHEKRVTYITYIRSAHVSASEFRGCVRIARMTAPPTCHGSTKMTPYPPVRNA